MAMKRKILFTIITVLVITILFSVAALCNQCSITAPAAETKNGVESETSGSKETNKDSGSVQADETKQDTAATKKDEETAAKETAAKETTVPTVAESPTITLKIYEGPTSSTGDVCYYRVEASVTGSPAPQVTFSKDDSGGAWGSKKVQINLTKTNPNYTLTAKAKNSTGEANASIDLSWGCGPLVEEKTVVLNPTIIGTVGPSGFADTTFLGIGDSVFNTDWRGRFAFDVSSLAGKDIKSAELGLYQPALTDPKCDFKGNIVIFFNDFLPGLTASDYYSTGTEGQLFTWDENPLKFSTDFLRDKVKERADSGVELQFGIGYELPLATNSNNFAEGRIYYTNKIILTVVYLE
jgi:hypothetical protein